MTTVEFILSIVCAAFASTGFWSLVMYKIQKRDKHKDSMTLLMLGIAHDLIMSKSAQFIAQGYVTKDEYGDFMKYLYNPYRDLGGDGTAEKVVEGQVKKLDIKIEVSHD